MTGFMGGVELSITGLITTLVALTAILFLRRLLPADRHKRGRTSLFLLSLSLLFRIAGTVAANLGNGTVARREGRDGTPDEAERFLAR